MQTKNNGAIKFKAQELPKERIIFCHKCRKHIKPGSTVSMNLRTGVVFHKECA